VKRSDLPNNYNEEYFRRYDYSEVYDFYAFRTACAINDVLHPKRMLDVGCEKGFKVLAFTSLGVEAYGVDISDYAIANSPIKAKQHHLFCMDVQKTNLPFASNYFDLVIILEVIEHLENWQRALKEIERVLSPSGFLYLTAPSPEEKCAYVDPTHITVYDRQTWEKHFIECGFQETPYLRKLNRLIWIRYRLLSLSSVKKPFDFVRLGYELLAGIFDVISYFVPLTKAHTILLLKKVEKTTNSNE
jgi:SAM-dependent methyltransferase